MAKHIVSATTTTAAGASTSIADATLNLQIRDVVEVGCDKTAGAWINHRGGTASVGGANCVHIPANGWRVLTLEATTLEAIREDATEAVVTVAKLGATP